VRTIELRGHEPWRELRARLEEDDDHNVVAQVSLALDLLLVPRVVGEERRDVEHDPLFPKLCVHRLGPRGFVCARVRKPSARQQSCERSVHREAASTRERVERTLYIEAAGVVLPSLESDPPAQEVEELLPLRVRIVYHCWV
jgi:hypothetical protein